MSFPVRFSLIAGLLAAAACKGPTDAPRAGPPTNIEAIVSPTTATVAEVLAPRVRVTDRNGIPVEGVEIRWIGADGAPAIPKGTNLTDENGENEAEWWLGAVAKTYTMSAHLLVGEDVNKTSVDVTTFSVVASPGPLTQLTAAGGDNQQSFTDRPPREPVVVRAVDRFGNPISGITITWTGSPNITVTPATSVTGADGTASTTWTGKPDASGQALITATAGTISRNFIGQVCGALADGC